MTLLALSAYDVSPTRGFVPEMPPAQSLPDPWGPLDTLADELPDRIDAGTLRRDVEDLPQLGPDDVDALADPRHRERCFLVTTALASALVNDPDSTSELVPARVPVPMAAIAQRLDRPGIPSWASLGMRNWRLRPGVTPDTAPSADNAKLLVAFDGGLDEAWFYLATLEVEVAGGRLP